MKVMMLAFLAIAVIGVVSYYGLNQIGYSSQEQYSSANVRLD